jgi:hypothetical protein
MTLGTSVWTSFKALGSREFWSFKVVHALTGAVLTLAGAAGGIFGTEHIKQSIAGVDGAIAESTRRIESIERALFQFRLIQTNGLMLAALSGNEGLRSEYRATFLALSFALRKAPTAKVLEELHANDVEAFKRGRAEHERLIAAAQPANDKAAWDAVLLFELEQERQLAALQQRFYDARYGFQEQRQALNHRLATTTVGGFVLQQLGFVVVLMAGLVHQHVDTRERHQASDPDSTTTHGEGGEA